MKYLLLFITFLFTTSFSNYAQNQERLNLNQSSSQLVMHNITNHHNLKQVDGTKMLIIIPHELYEEIEYYIDRCVIELIGENFNPELYTFESGNHEDLRQFLAEKYSEGMQGCIMIGDLPIAYYHTINCNSHQPSAEVFPCDLFYMDLDGEFIDTDNDGDYDDQTGNVAPEIWFGRLYTNTLTAGGIPEKELMIRYFNKNHLYRSELNSLPKRAMLYIDDDFHTHDSFYEAVSQAYNSIVLYEDDAITSEEHYKDIIPDGYELMQVCVHGLPNAHTFIQHSGAYSNLTHSEIIQCNPVSHFVILYGCSNAKYTRYNCLANWYTFHENNIVATLGSGKSGSQLFHYDFYIPFGTGSTIGEAFMQWFVDQTEDGMEHWERCCFGGLTLLGDPTLKMQKFQSNNWINIIPENLDTAYSGTWFTYEIKTDETLTPEMKFEIISGHLPNGIQLIDNEISGEVSLTETGDFVFTVKLFDEQNPHEYDIQHFVVHVENEVGIDNPSSSKLNHFQILYDNNFNEIIVSSLRENQPQQHIQIYDLLGNQIFNTGNNVTLPVSINISNLEISSGIYIVKVFNQTACFTKKILINY